MEERRWLDVKEDDLNINGWLKPQHGASHRGRVLRLGALVEELRRIRRCRRRVLLFRLRFTPEGSLLLQIPEVVVIHLIFLFRRARGLIV